MINISGAINEITSKNSVLLWGLSNKLFNLSQLSRFLHSLVETRTKKSVQQSAILMNLSRLQSRISKISPKRAQFKVEDITTRSNLTVLTFEKLKLVRQKINEFYKRLEGKNEYISITEGTSEITLVFDTKLRRLLGGIKPKKEYSNISAIALRFPEKYVNTPGFIYTIVQELALQNINIIEICSTYTELIIYVTKEDTRLTFDTIFDQFSGSGSK
jgi:aspartokinase